MRSSTDFRATVRRGVRVGRPTMVVHASSVEADDVLVGFVVSKAVGNAVTRNRVKRRLRHLAAACLPMTPSGARLVVRATPAAAAAAAPLAVDLPAAWKRALDRVADRGGFS